MQSRLYATAALLAALSAPVPAFAHAQLRQADPPAGGAVHAPPQVQLTFSEAVEPRFSTVVVSDAAGHQVDKQDLHVPGTDAHHVAIGLAPLPPGAYTVTWHATSVDTHKTEGTFTFTVVP